MRRSYERIILVAIALVSVAIYLPVATFDFLNLDDQQHIILNPWVAEGLSAEGVRWALLNTDFDLWMPATWLSLMTDATLFGLQPAGYHLVNVLFHALNCLLLSLALRGLPLAAWQRLLVVALFALHPQHVEVVAWVIERKELLAMTFGLLSWIAWQRWREGAGTVAYLASMAALLLSLASKPMWVTWPVILFVIEAARAGWSRSEMRAAAKGAAPLLLIAGVFALVTVVGAGGNSSLVPFSSYPLTERFEWILAAYRYYVVKSFLPFDLSPYVEHWSSNRVAHDVLQGGFLLVVVTLGTFRLRRARPLLFAGWSWFVIGLFPVAGISQIGGHWVADRYSYFPHVGLFVAIVAVLPKMTTAAVWARAVVAMPAAVILFGLSQLTMEHIPHWQNSVTVWSRASELTPSPYVHYQFGNFYSDTGDPEQAVLHYHQSVRLKRNAPGYLVALAQAGLRSGDLRLARHASRQVAELGIDPLRPERLLDLSSELLTEQEYGSARPLLVMLLDFPGVSEQFWYGRLLLNHALLNLADGDRPAALEWLYEVRSVDGSVVDNACRHARRPGRNVELTSALLEICTEVVGAGGVE